MFDKENKFNNLTKDWLFYVKVSTSLSYEKGGGLGFNLKKGRTGVLTCLSPKKELWQFI